MHPLQEPFLCQFAKVAADGVFGKIQFLADMFGDDLSFLLQL